MKFQNCILINFERTHKQTHGQAQSNMPLQCFQSWGHKDSNESVCLCLTSHQHLRSYGDEDSA